MARNPLPVLSEVGYISAYRLGETVRGINAFVRGLHAVHPASRNCQETRMQLKAGEIDGTAPFGSKTAYKTFHCSKFSV